MAQRRFLYRSLSVTVTGLVAALAVGLIAAWITWMAIPFLQMSFDKQRQVERLPHVNLEAVLVDWHPPLDVEQPLAFSTIGPGKSGCGPRQVARLVAKKKVTQSIALTPCMTSDDAKTELLRIELSGPTDKSTVLAFPAVPEIVYREPGASLIGRAWIQAQSVVVLESYCGQLAEEPCDALSVQLAQSLSNQFSGPHESSQPAYQDKLGRVVIATPLLFWLMCSAPFRLIDLIRRQRFISPAGVARYQDLSAEVSQITTARIALRVAVALCSLGFLGLLSVGAAWSLQEPFWSKRQAWLACLVLIFLSVGAILASRGWKQLRPLRLHVTPSSRQGWRSILGTALRRASNLGTIFCIALYLVYVAAAFVSAGVSDRFITERINAVENLTSFGAIMQIGFLLMVMLTRVDASGLVFLGIIPPLMLLFFIDRIGQRLAMRSVREAINATEAPHFLLLRSFDEDRVTIKATVSRKSIMSRLLPFRRRGFEEVVAASISQYGPVIAVSPPGKRLPRLGAAKVLLPHSDWQGQVRAWAEDSLAVVLMATPATINPGFDWELCLTGVQLPHGRILLILPPQRKRRMVQGWQLFVSAASRYARYVGLESTDVPDGTQALVRSSSAPQWFMYGARTRNEAAYIKTIRAAITTHIDEWKREHAEQHLCENHGSRSAGVEPL